MCTFFAFLRDDVFIIENNEGRLFEPITSDLGLHQLISEPTHLMGNSKSCIDLMFTDQPNLVIESGVHPSLHEQLYAELGWESLSSRRWSRRLTLFYKIINNLTPTYMKDPIPQPPQSRYSLRNQDVVGRTLVRTEKFKSSFHPHCLSEWNKIDPEIRLAPSVAVFKAKLLSIIRPPAKSVFGIYDPIG